MFTYVLPAATSARVLLAPVFAYPRAAALDTEGLVLVVYAQEFDAAPYPNFAAVQVSAIFDPRGGRHDSVNRVGDSGPGPGPLFFLVRRSYRRHVDGR